MVTNMCNPPMCAWCPRAHFQWPWVPRVPRTCVVPLLCSIIRIGMHNESLYRRTIRFISETKRRSCLPRNCIGMIARAWDLLPRGHNHRMRKPPQNRCAQRPRVSEREWEETPHLDYWRKFSILCVLGLGKNCWSVLNGMAAGINGNREGAFFGLASPKAETSRDDSSQYFARNSQTFESIQLATLCARGCCGTTQL